MGVKGSTTGLLECRCFKGCSGIKGCRQGVIGVVEEFKWCRYIIKGVYGL